MIAKGFKFSVGACLGLMAFGVLYQGFLYVVAWVAA